MQLTTTTKAHFIEVSEDPLLEPDMHAGGALKEAKIVASDAKSAFQAFKAEHPRLKCFGATVSETGHNFSSFGKQYKVEVIPFRPYAKVSATIVLPFLQTEKENGELEVFACAQRDLESGGGSFLIAPTTASLDDSSQLHHKTHMEKALELLHSKGIEKISFDEIEDTRKFEIDRLGGKFRFNASKLDLTLKKILAMKTDKINASIDDVTAYACIMKTKKTKKEIEKAFQEKNFVLIDITQDLKASSGKVVNPSTVLKILSYMNTFFLSKKDLEMIVLKGLESVSLHYYQEGRKKRAKIIYTAVAIVVSYMAKQLVIRCFAGKR
jgi:hypothetical protein